MDARLVVRLARNQAEITAFQALRYRIFYEEMSAVAGPRTAMLARDCDDFDSICDHLLVIDLSRGRGMVVGGYRLLRSSVARRRGGFYTAAEYDIAALAARPGEMLELGRSCVHAGYRRGAVIQLLMRGIAAYIDRHRIGLIFGCASLPGTDPQDLALPLSYLAHNHLAPPNLRTTALADRYVEMKRMPHGAIDPRTAISALPPLIKGYLRAGGMVGDGAVIDAQRISHKFRRRYQRHDA